MPERVEEDLRTAPLFVRPGVPVVEDVEEVGVRRSPPEYICWGYCEFMVAVVGDAAASGNTAEEFVRVRICPIWASKGTFAGGPTVMFGFAIGFRRRGRAAAMIDDCHSLVTCETTLGA